MKRALIFYFVVFLIGCYTEVSAQSDTSSNTKKDIFNASVSYQSALHYFGRTDSLQSSGLLPTLGYQLKCGVYVQGTAVLSTNSAQPLTYAGTAIEGGYRLQTSHFSGNVFFTKFLYKDNSTLVQSALKEQTGINAAYTNKIVNINVGGDLKFSDKTDVGATFGLDKLIIFKQKDEPIAFAIDPSFYVYAGTQNFSQTYLQKKTVLLFPVTEQSTEQVSRFGILSYELSMPIVYVNHKFNAFVSPAYVMPQNLIEIAGQPQLSEHGSNLFYVTIGVGLRI